MLEITGDRGSGKTKMLLEIAKEKNATVVCNNPYAIKEKARLFGIGYIKAISYNTYFDICKRAIIDLELLEPTEVYAIDDIENIENCGYKLYNAIICTRCKK